MREADENSARRPSMSTSSVTKVVHKYDHYYDHMCSDPEITDGDGCCSRYWRKVTCKKCLVLKPRRDDDYEPSGCN